MGLASHSVQPPLNSLTLSNDLLAVYKVARGFESSLLRHAVCSFRDSLRLCVKNTHWPESAPQVHRRTTLVGVQTRVLDDAVYCGLRRSKAKSRSELQANEEGRYPGPPNGFATSPVRRTPVAGACFLGELAIPGSAVANGDPAGLRPGCGCVRSGPCTPRHGRTC